MKIKYEQLRKEIDHIFESGANEIRIYNMIVSFLENNRADSLKVKKAVEILERHNKWRRGDDSIDMEDPTKLGKAIDIVVKEMKNRHIVDFSEMDKSDKLDLQRDQHLMSIRQNGK